MSDAAGPPPLPAAKPVRPKWQRWAIIALGVVAVLRGGLALLRYLSPDATAGCSDPRIVDSLRDIFKKVSPLGLTTLSDVTQRPESTDKVACVATMAFSDGHSEKIGYELTRADGNTTVEVTGSVP